MEPFGKKNKRKFHFEYVWIVIIIVYLSFLGIRSAWQKNQLIKEYNQLIIKLEKEEEQTLKLRKKISRLQDPQYVEYLARDRLGLAKPGEKVYKLINSETERSAEATSGGKY